MAPERPTQGPNPLIGIRKNMSLSETNKRIWDDFVPDYVDERVEKVLSLLPLTTRNPEYLDIGCSTGSATMLVARRIKAKTVKGVDFVHTGEAKKKGVDAIDCDLNSGKPLPYEDKTFHLVTCMETLEHVHDTDYLLSEIYRVLRDDGTAIIDIPRLDSMMNTLLLLFGFQPPGVECSTRERYGAINQGSILTGHISYFTKRAFRDILRSNGFIILKFEQSGQKSDWEAVQAKLGRRPGTMARLLWGLYDIFPFKKDYMIMKVRKEAR
ncbi:MAG: class I SAM-dependent methyltransferase [Thermodesulfobacteriota bacterium]